MVTITEIWPVDGGWRYRVIDEFGEAARGERPTREAAEGVAHRIATACKCGKPDACETWSAATDRESDDGGDGADCDEGAG